MRPLTISIIPPKHLSQALLTSGLLLISFQVSADLLVANRSIPQNTTYYGNECPVTDIVLPLGPSAKYQKINGRKNNRRKAAWGAAGSLLIRQVAIDDSRYPNGDPATALPNPRQISNIVVRQDRDTYSAKGLSDMFWLWGQFLDHDITLVHTNSDPDESADIIIPEGDDVFPVGSSLPFNRSSSRFDRKERRQHPNVITSFIDGSNIYGSDKDTERALRTFEGGQLMLDEHKLLPKNPQGLYMAGDERANEHIGLTSMHTLWVREHNRIAEAIACKHPRWKDKRLYNEARRIVIAELQAITYNEFLPALLGKKALPGYWRYSQDQLPGYQSRIKPNISNLFAAATYRFGHSMLSPNLLRLDENGAEIPQGHVSLGEAFFQPQKVAEAGIEPILRGLASQPAQALDPMIIDTVRNFLILMPNGVAGFDLASLNIQRGRDHGLPGYNTVRESLGLERIDSFDDPIWRSGFGAKLAAAYDDPDAVDLWVGGLAEKETADALVGETMQLILLDQFRRLRHGDRFWYEHYFFGRKLKALNNLKLSTIIKRNTPIENVQEDVFVASNIHSPIRASGLLQDTPEAAVRLGSEARDEQQVFRILQAILAGQFG